MIRRLALLLAVAPLLAGASIDTRMAPNAPGFNVRGAAEFCASHAETCRAAGADRIPETAELRRHLEAVNAEVNGRISFRDDVDDAWTISPAAGDCEDFAVTKLVYLVRAGLPRRALRLAVVQVARPQIALNGDRFTVWAWHMVLTVETDQGTLVLDSLRAGVADWTPTGDRTWVALEQPRQGRMAFARLIGSTDKAFEEGR